MSSVDDVVLTERFAGFTIASVLANRAASDSGRAYLRFHADKRRFMVGRPISGTEIRITEADGEELPIESVGKI